MTPLPPTPIFEPELSFLPHACGACGERFSTEGDLDVHRREACPMATTPATKPNFGFGCMSPWYGVADGGRRM